MRSRVSAAQGLAGCSHRVLKFPLGLVPMGVPCHCQPRVRRDCATRGWMLLPWQSVLCSVRSEVVAPGEQGRHWALLLVPLGRVLWGAGTVAAPLCTCWWLAPSSTASTG